MSESYEEHIKRIIAKLELGKNNADITINALIEIFTTPSGDINPYYYPIDKDGTSQIDLLSDKLREKDSVIGESLLQILLSSEEDFEKRLGMYDKGGMWFRVQNTIFSYSEMKTGSAIVIASRRAEKIKTGKFDNLPYSNKHRIMEYCININKDLFTEEEILQEADKIVITKQDELLIQILVKYSPDRAINEIIKLGDYNIFFRCFEFFKDKNLYEKVKKECRDKLDDEQKEGFEGYFEQESKN